MVYTDEEAAVHLKILLAIVPIVQNYDVKTVRDMSASAHCSNILHTKARVLLFCTVIVRSVQSGL